MTRTTLALAIVVCALAAAPSLVSCSSSSSSDSTDAAGSCHDDSFSNFYALDAGPDVATTPEGCDAACAAEDPGFQNRSCCHGFGYGCSYLGTSLACVFSCHQLPDAAGQ